MARRNQGTNSSSSKISQRERESKLFGKRIDGKAVKFCGLKSQRFSSEPLPKPPSRLKAQSAMEYLMTYGWAILIIAIVMVALFSLGVFSSASSAPRAHPGSCQVLDGSVVGVCNLEPQYVAYFDGLSPGIVGPQMTVNINTNSYTMCAWAKIPVNLPNSYGDVLVAVDFGYTGLEADTYGSPIITAWLDWMGGGFGSVTFGAWHFYCAVYPGDGSTTRVLYMDGSNIGSATGGSAGSFTGSLIIGNNGHTCCNFTSNPPDYESNVQLYDTALSQSGVSALYKEGIGGSPIDTYYLMGWWPLNGNAQDYSGNGNDGTATDVSWNSQWTSGYSQP